MRKSVVPVVKKLIPAFLKEMKESKSSYLAQSTRPLTAYKQPSVTRASSKSLHRNQTPTVLSPCLLPSLSLTALPAALPRPRARRARLTKHGEYWKWLSSRGQWLTDSFSIRFNVPTHILYETFFDSGRISAFTASPAQVSLLQCHNKFFVTLDMMIFSSIICQSSDIWWHVRSWLQFYLDLFPGRA